MRMGESILDLKKRAIELGLTDIHKTTQQKVIINGKILQDNIIIADVSMFTGSTRFSAIITSAGDEIQLAFNKDNLGNRLQKLPSRKRSRTIEPFRGLSRRNQRNNRLMPAFNESPTKILRAEGTPVKAE